MITTTPSPTHCFTNSKNIDAIFVIDGSGSVGREPFAEALNFVITIVEHFAIGVGQSRVGVIVFHSSATISLSLENSATMGKEKIIEVIRNTPYPGGGTNTGRAISAAEEHFERFGRLTDDSVSSMAFVLTHGQSGDDVTEPADNAEKKGITIYAIGIGSGIDFDELN